MTQAAEAGIGQRGEARPLSRRDRLRAATKDEITQTARRLLVQDGPESVSLRAIAREIGMTAPGLYRYFTSHEELLRHVCADIFTELGNDIRVAIHDADEQFWESVGTDPLEHECTPEQHRVKLTAKVVAACREFRRWSLEHPSEFSVMFGAPLPGIDDGRYNISDDCAECALQFAGTFFALFIELWNHARFPVPEPEDINEQLLEQLVRYRDGLGVDLPAGAVLTFLRCWVLLYGAVSMEVFGHLSFALEEASAMFEFTLSDLARLVGLRYPA